MEKHPSAILLICILHIAFSAGTVLDVLDFGAPVDGSTNDRAAIRKAIDSCAPDGGTAALKNGVFLAALAMMTNGTLEDDRKRPGFPADRDSASGGFNAMP